VRVNPGQRFRRKEDPCPICGGWERAARGQGIRCHGYRATNPEYVYCTREDAAGALAPDPATGLYRHYLAGPCHCGVTHQGAPPPRARGLIRRRPEAPLGPRTLVATYDYLDEHGALGYRKHRYRLPDGAKTFRFERPDPERVGRWVPNLEGVRRVVYLLPELQGQAFACAVEDAPAAD
jgi:hypothetical protein